MNTLTKEFSKEQLIKRLEAQMSSARYALGFVQDSEILRDIEMDLRLAEIARASLTAEPIGAFHISDQQVEGTSDYIKDGEWPIDNGVIEVYIAPPVPSGWVLVPLVPTQEMCDAVLWSACPSLDGDGARFIYNVMTDVAPDAPVSNRDELPEEKAASLQLRNLIRQLHAEWSDATFGNVGPVGPLKHLSKEALEAAAEPGDLSEWADMQFLLWDAQRRAGISDGEITAAMEEKLAINKTRQWPEPKDGEPRLHIKEQSESVLPEIECDICGHVSTDPEGRHHCCEDNSND